MAGYEKKFKLLLDEIIVLKEEGHVINEKYYQDIILKYQDDLTELENIYQEMQKTPLNELYAYVEPNTFQEIRQESDYRLLSPSFKKVTYDDIYGAWLGRIIGCMIGLPVEGATYIQIKNYLIKMKAYPLNNYFPLDEERLKEENLSFHNKECFYGFIEYAPTDDDIRYNVLAYKLVKEKGFHFNSFDVADNWISTLPFRDFCTAENQAYLNYINLDSVQPWKRKRGDIEPTFNHTAHYLNPYRQWIGAQIRIDTYGYLAAGNPQLASKMAYHDARFSHTKNGIYGAMYFGALISLAFVSSSIEEAIKKALNVVPKRSSFYDAIKKTITICENIDSRDELIVKINEAFQDYSWVHTISNASIVVAALLYGKGKFRESICLGVMMGKDTDCNGATIGSIVGAFHGASNIPLDLKEPLNDTLYSSVCGYHPIKISEMARLTYELFLENKKYQD